MNVGDIVYLLLPLQQGTEPFKIIGRKAALPGERGPLVLRLESTVTGRRIHDHPSSRVTKETP